MTLVLELPPELESQLAARAVELRLPLDEYALRILASGAIPAPNVQNGAEILDYWKQHGLIGTKSHIADASAHVRTLRQAAEKRSR